MITDSIINLAYSIITLLIGIFPTSPGFPSDFQTAITTIAGYSTIADAILPFSTLGQIIGLIIAFELLVFSWKGLRFILSYVPFIGGRQ